MDAFNPESIQFNIPLILFTDDYLHCTCSLHVTSIASLIVHAIVHDKHDNMIHVLQYFKYLNAWLKASWLSLSRKPKYKALKP